VFRGRLSINNVKYSIWGFRPDLLTFIGPESRPNEEGGEANGDI